MELFAETIRAAEGCETATGFAKSCSVAVLAECILDLGLLAEAGEATAGPKLLEQFEPFMSTMRRVVELEAKSNLTRLGNMLRLNGDDRAADRELLAWHPLATDNPEHTADIHQIAMNMMCCRERLHRLREANRLFGNALSDRDFSFDRDDELRELVGCCDGMDAWRQRMSLDLPDNESEAHWWFTDPTHETHT